MADRADKDSAGGEHGDGPDGAASARETGAPGEAEIAFGRWLFAQACTFVTGAADPAYIPESELPEIAFAGRSNVGKSSLINALVKQRALARTSKTPGRTQQINFFDLGGRLMLADLPGYGYARASKTEVAGWTKFTRLYLRGRVELRRVCVLIDARHGLKTTDTETMSLLDKAAVPYQAVLTKCDALKPTELAAVQEACAATLKRRPAAYPWIAATSARTGFGIEALQGALGTLARNGETG